MITDRLKNALRKAIPTVQFDKEWEKLTTKLAGAPVITVGAEDTNVIVATIQLKDHDGDLRAQKRMIRIWLSSTSQAVPAGTPPSGTVSITTGVLVQTRTAKVDFDVLSNSSGKIAISVTEAGTKSFFLNVLDDDQLVTAELVFA